MPHKSKPADYYTPRKTGLNHSGEKKVEFGYQNNHAASINPSNTGESIIGDRINIPGGKEPPTPVLVELARPQCSHPSLKLAISWRD